MRKPPPPPVFSRRAFILFIFLAPTGLLTIAAIIAALQYRQFQAMVSPAPAIAAIELDADQHARVGSLQRSLQTFANSEGPDSLWFSDADMTLLASSSPLLEAQRLRVRIGTRDTLMIVETSQPVSAIKGRFSGIFQRITPVEDGWLNARMEGSPAWNEGRLEFAPLRGWLNEVRIPRAALTKRRAMSPRDFVDGEAAQEYAKLTAVLDRVEITDGGAALVRRR